MAYIYVNPNPKGAHIGDCVIRAIAIANEMTWNQTYNTLADYGFKMKNMPNADSVWGKVLKDMGYTMKPIPDTCPDCYTIRDFCKDHPMGTYVLGTGSHVVAVRDGNYFDTWDSGDEVPIIYWRKRDV